MSNTQEIPIENIYYMLYYAWNKLEEADIVDVKNIDTNELVDLFAKVLIGGISHLIKKGFDRGYIEITEETKKLRGKIDFSASIKRNLIKQVKLVCVFDDFSYNVLHNRIIKSTILSLIKVKELDIELKNELVGLYKFFHEIDLIELRSNIFSRVQLNRNNFFYDFLIKICEMVYNNVLISEKSGESKFRNFIRDEIQMRYIFENFVRNFYAKEQDEFQLLGKGREDIYWDAELLNETPEGYLPKMQTDVSLISENRKIIIDTKYYRNVLSSHNRKEYKDIHGKIISTNLYQLFSYLKNVERKNDISQECEGILLYPTTDKALNLNYKIQGHKIGIKTVNLNQPWRNIYDDLLGVIGL